MESFKTVIKIWIITAKVTPKKFTVAVFTMLLTSSMPVLASYVLAQAIGELSSIGDGFDKDRLFLMVVFYIVFTLIQETADELFNSMSSLLMRYDISRYFIDIVFKKINEVDLEFFENTKYADLKAKALDTYEWRPGDLMRVSIYAAQKFVEAFIAGAAILMLIPTETLFILLAILPSLITDYKFQAGAWDIWTTDTKTRREYGYLLNISNDHEVKFTKELRLLGLGNYFREMLNKLVLSVHLKQQRIQEKRMIGKILVNLVPITVIGYILFALTNQVIAGELSIANFTFIVTNVIVFKNRFTFAMFDLAFTMSEAKYVRDVFNFLAVEPEIKDKPNAISNIQSPPSIEFKNLTFRYPGTKKDVLTNFNLKIEAGQSIALVGENGVGKSTIVKLLLRFYDPTEGAILINGVDLKDLNIESWRTEVAALLQDFRTFKMITIEDNIGLGKLAKYIDQKKQTGNKDTLVEIIESSKQAKSHPFIGEEGYQQRVGREFGGDEFSGGETQRLALARTFYRNAGLIIMDEPTSAVDAKAEMQIFQSIEDHLKQKTVIFVSHRFSTVRVADRILVMQNGSIVEDGTHEELLAKEGIYSEMFRAQAKGYE